MLRECAAVAAPLRFCLDASLSVYQIQRKERWSHIGKKVSLCFSVLNATCRLVMECFCAYMIPQAKRKASFKEGQERFFSLHCIDFSKNVLFLSLNRILKVYMYALLALTSVNHAKMKGLVYSSNFFLKCTLRESNHCLLKWQPHSITTIPTNY